MSEIVEEKYFLSYSGIGLPLKMVSPLESEGLENRNTYFIARYNSDGLLVEVIKQVYNEIELHHEYTYNPDGKLIETKITGLDGDVNIVKAPS